MMLLRAAPVLTLVVMLGPLAAGAIGTVLPALGYLPALGGQEVTPAPWLRLFATPGIGISIRHSVMTGLIATGSSLLIVALICASWQGTRLFIVLRRALSPILSVPHAAAAFSLAFLIAPSGWIARMVSPWATGWDRPPDIAIVQDPWGLALIAGLVIKEVPFLLLMTLAALGQVDARRTRLVASGLGYGRVSGWLKTVFPRIYPQIRLPVYAVLAYSMSVVDVAVILAPTTPPPLAVRLVTWFDDPDLSLRFQACAGAVLQLGLVIGAIGLWRLGEIAAARLARRWIEGGGRGLRDGPVRLLGAGAVIVGAGAVMLGAAGLTVWSFAGYWRFPDALPRAFTLRIWERRGSGLIDPLATTVGIGAAATLVAIVLCLACLENEGRPGRRPGMRALWLLYVPLIVPQTGFLFGLQMLVSVLGGGYHLSMLVLCHLVFVLPYVFLSLSDPYRAWDVRLGRTAACLGARPGRVFWRVRLPMLTAPVLTAAAVGFAVSVGQYLPTLLIGGGRFTTITTEAVALAAGGDRRLIGVYALMQMVLPFIAFSLAVAVPGMLFRRRRGMGVSP